MKVPQNVSESTRRRNPHLYPVVGPIQGAVRKHDIASALECKVSGKGNRRSKVAVCRESGGPFYRVTLVAFQRILQDSDRAIGGLTDLRDVIADWLLPDVSQRMRDSDKLIHWEYGFVQSNGEEGVAVRIEKL